MDTDVVVVGAGAAGLAAALWLAKRSIRVTLLEGRDRIGGRVMWRPVGSVDVPAELGAEFIHGAAPETSAFLLEAGLANIETGSSSWIHNSAGDLRPEEDDSSVADIFERVRDVTDDESVATFLGRFKSDPRLRAQAHRARSFVEGFEAADPRLASARSIADELRTGIDSASSRPVGSYAPLFEYLAAQCGRAGIELHLNTTVERIVWKPGDVTIEARGENGDPCVVHARGAIITVPVGVLRQSDGANALLFAPPLPPEKQVALRGLEMGHAVRVTLAFRTPFWERVAGGRYRDAAFFQCENGALQLFGLRCRYAAERSSRGPAGRGRPRLTSHRHRNV